MTPRLIEQLRRELARAIEIHDHVAEATIRARLCKGCPGAGTWCVDCLPVKR